MHLFRRLRPILVALALSAVASCSPSPSEVDSVSVKRTESGNQVDVAWTIASDQPVDIYYSSDPASSLRAMQRIGEKVQSPTFSFTPPNASRPYFAIAPAGTDKAERVAERILPLKGGRNFRDLGGYETNDGKRTRWGLLYRSGAMHNLTPEDYRYLGTLGIRVVCDLRATSEREHEPTQWGAEPKPELLSVDYGSDTRGLASVIAAGAAATENMARGKMIEIYTVLPTFFKESYAGVFKRLASGEIPLAFNCSAGKDRTGVLAALILTALGVPRETVKADYALSNTYLDIEGEIARKAETNGPTPPSPFMQLPESARAAILRADPAYLDAAFAKIDQDFGSFDAYLRDFLGISDAERAKIRDLLTEPATW